MKLECNFFAGSARILNEETVMDVVKDLAQDLGQDEPFYILNVGDIVQKIKIWRLKMPRVKPFYAVKCNDDPTVLEILAALGTGFDCASKAEMQKVLQMGVDPSRIIYAHPCKPASHLRQAAKFNIPLMTFDNETELLKVKTYYPEAQLVLRFRYDANDAQCPLGIKFGVLPQDAGPLLATARSLDLNIVGVSFHVGSGCREPAVYYRAIAAAKQLFDEAEALGFTPNLLDIGGGFPGCRNSPLDEVADHVNKALDEFFPEDTGVKVIAEPGRYVVASAFTLATSILAKREVCDNNGTITSVMYYINDGVYGSFNCTIYDHQTVHPILLEEPAKDEPYMPCSIWGPTCDGLDQVISEIRLPRLSCGDWLIWPEMGAYTLAAAGTFNGFPLPKVHVVVPHHTWLYLEEHLGSTVNFNSVGGASFLGGCSGTNLPVAEDSVSSTNSAYCSCAATFDNINLEEQLAQLTVIDVGEM
ncbi:ornithine decarboxylase 1-like [Homarus americanus]|uniref:ornithine decarboxylase 1-like n=1 Tax=Homarus americanus TaxID=6706 RepID=UPI001C44A0A7|nr:ornithine decarboxylase 1-like [Homarus americanus]XP_042205540.1 ornithine decarboxylase 1-like [Homarus americanus]